MTVQMSRHGEQDVVEHVPVRQESSLDFIRGSLRCSESDVLDVMCVSPPRRPDRANASSGNVFKDGCRNSLTLGPAYMSLALNHAVISQIFVPQVIVFSGIVGSFVAIHALMPPTISLMFVRPAFARMLQAIAER